MNNEKVLLLLRRRGSATRATLDKRLAQALGLSASEAALLCATLGSRWAVAEKRQQGLMSRLGFRLLCEDHR